MQISSFGITTKKAMLLGGASAVVIVAGLAGSSTFGVKPAMAADADVILSGITIDAQVVAETALASDVVNSAEIEALILDNSATITSGTNATATPAVTNSGLAVDGNSAFANAIGNTVDSEADITAVTGVGSGLGVANAMLNDPDSQIRSEVADTEVGYGLDSSTGNVTGSSVSVSDNNLTALTEMNVATTVVDDTTLANEAISSTTAGDVNFGSTTTPVGGVETQGEIAVVTSQINADDDLDPNVGSAIEGSSSVVQNNDLGIEIDVTTSTAPNASGSFTVDGNDLLAQFRGNTSETGVDASAATSFEGSIAVANQQANNFLTNPVDSDGEPLPAVASLLNNDIIASFSDSLPGDFSVLDGGVSVSGNTMGSDATGNLGSSFITFDASTDLTGADGGASTGGVVDLALFGEPSNTEGDLTLVNQQANVAFATSSASNNNRIGVIFDDIAPGSDDGSGIDVDQNEIFAQSTGNSGTNAITGDANQIDATAALSSAQVTGRRATGATAAPGILGSADTTASVDTASIGVDSTGFAGTTLNDSSIDVTVNAVTARAEGNFVENSVDLAADAGLTAGDTEADVDGGFNLTSTPAADPLSAEAGSVLSNFQGLVNSRTSASVTDAQIGATVNATSDVTGSEITVAGEDLNGDDAFASDEMTRITATAIGQTGLNSMSLSSDAGTLAGSAALVSTQLQGGQDPVDGIGTFASVDTSIIGIDLDIDDGDLVESSLDVTRADVAAVAQGNRVTNDVSVTAGSTLALDADGDTDIDLTPNGDDQATPQSENNSNSVVLANTQISNTSTGASVNDIQLGTALDASVDASSITVDSNRVRAEATGNLVASQSPGNSLTIDAGTLDAAGADDTLAAITNVQDLTGRPGQVTTVTADVDDVFFDNDVEGDALNATLSASSNTLTSRAVGNVTDENFLNVIGGNISYGGGDQDSDMLVGLFGTATTNAMSPMDVEIDTEEAFVIANVQRGSVDGVTATAGTDVGVGADVTVSGTLTGNDIESSSVEVSSNRFEALAFDNSGANTIQFGETAEDGSVTPVTTLATTSAIVSQQIAAGDTTATLGQPGTPGTPATPPSLLDNIQFAGTNIAISNATTETVGGGGTLEIDTSALTSSEEAALLSAVQSGLIAGASANLTSGDNILVTFSSGSDAIDLSAFAIPNVGDLTGTSGTATTGQFFVGGTSAQDPSFAAPTIIADIGGDITNSSVNVSSNVNTAVARANSVTNTLEAMATTLTGDTDAVTPGVRVEDTDPGEVGIDTSADNQVSSLQTRDPGADVSATAFAGVGISTSLEEGGDSVTIEGSDLAVDGNVLSASAEGNVASNLVGADATTLGIDTGSISTDSTMTSALSNVQISLAGGSATAGQAAGTGDFVADLFAPIAVDNSSVSISDNTTQATTTLNSASNTVDITAVNVLSLEDSLPGQSLFNIEDPTSSSGFQFGEFVSIGQGTLSNAQVASESDPDDIASASAVMNIGNTDALVADSNGLTNSSIVVDGNRAQASVTGNAATNTLSQNGDATIDATSVLSNAQFGDITVDADSTLDARLELSSGAVTPHSNSSVSMSGNVNLASGTSNEAQNRVSVSGANIDGAVAPQGSGIAFLGELTDGGGVLGDLPDFDVGAVGSTVASNQQFSDADVSADAVTNILHSDTALNSGITGTSMMQDDNLTIAEAVGNVSGPNSRRTMAEQQNGIFGDTINVSGGNIDGATVALSNQEGNGNISASATVDVVNDMIGTSLENSSVSITGNQTAAFAAQNEATQSVVVDGTSIAGVESDTFAGIGSGTTQVNGSPVGIEGQASVGDNLVFGQQRSIGEEVTSDVTVNIRASQEAEPGATGGAPITGSNVTISENIAESSAAGNRAAYSLSLNAASTLSATGAVSNAQFNSAAVTATATMDASIVNATPDLLDDLTQSSASVTSNTTVARARGNSGTNVLNAASGTGINTGTGITAATSGTASGGNSLTTPTVGIVSGTLARADYAVMSEQQNTGPINALISGSVGEVLNTGNVGSSSIRVAGNVMSADAVANSVTNQIVSSSMNNVATTYALANSQNNSGNVTSSVSGGSYGMSVGSMTGSSGAVSGNSISARSVGNSATNSIGGRN